jgi:hypothetical protein
MSDKKSVFVHFFQRILLITIAIGTVNAEADTLRLRDGIESYNLASEAYFLEDQSRSLSIEQLSEEGR